MKTTSTHNLERPRMPSGCVCVDEHIPVQLFRSPSIRTSTAQDLITRRHHAILRPKAVLRREAHTHREYTMAGTNPTSREAHRGWSAPSSTHTPVQRLRLPSSSSHPSPYPHQPSWSSQLLTPQCLILASSMLEVSTWMRVPL